MCLRCWIGPQKWNRASVGPAIAESLEEEGHPHSLCHFLICTAVQFWHLQVIMGVESFQKYYMQMHSMIARDCSLS
jgi:hypothetical protein